MAAFTTALLIGLATTAVKAAGEHQAGTAAKAAAESEAQLAEFNAGVADQQATDAVARGAEEESTFRSKVRTLLGSQRAGSAGGNIDVTSGSAVDVQADTAYLGELDALQIRNNAAREAWGFKVSAVDYRKQAEIARKGGAASARAANVAAAGTLLGGGERLAWAIANRK